LPGFLSRVDARGLRIGDATVDLRYERTGRTTQVAVVDRTGDVTVAVEY
jgi:hypothetical protein